MTPHRQEEAKKRVPAHVRVVVDVHCPVCGASFDDIGPQRPGRLCGVLPHLLRPVKAGDRALHGEASASREGCRGQTCRSRGKAASWL